MSEDMVKMLVDRLADEFSGQLEDIRELLADVKETQGNLCKRVETIESTDVYLRRNGGNSWVIRVSPWARRLIAALLLALASAFGFSSEIRERFWSEVPAIKAQQEHLEF